MTPAVGAAAIVLALAGAFLAYAGGANQRLTVTGGARPALAWAGIAALAASLVLMLCRYGPATAVFVWMTAASLMWSLLPLAVAWWRRPRGNAE